MLRTHSAVVTITFIVTVVLAVQAQQSSDFSNRIEETPPVPEKVCYGFNQGLTFSGTPLEWYERLRNTYTNCTIVIGNLLVTWLDDPTIAYDISFLRHVRYVSGSLLIAVCDIRNELDLSNLEIIRGNRTVSGFFGSDRSFSLVIALTNFTVIKLPRLRDITNGDVIVRVNSANLHVELSRDWDDILGGRLQTDSLAVDVNGLPPAVTLPRDGCPADCPRRCSKRLPKRCCHSQCAGGCWGPRDSQCELCKDYRLLNRCVSYCPYQNPRTFLRGRTCKLNPLNTSLGRSWNRLGPRP